MSPKFEAHQMAGRTDGKPSWRKVFIPNAATFSREAAVAAVEELKKGAPNGTFRVRKARATR